ncbi:Hachiman antiphage defense system protein HamA [Corallococcus macrosporus]|uniref:Anti-bacteriophage protein A/HamA C-terminal domain-containing protein n=1 Tax=Corallococcus macrosporus DSM 14697 TaxID=1189310 RepID=A0A250JXR5_9BACT|nr:Hachiman antiphage defense system protein HamA [Corallococcus macrosporus]ATB48420.1 hypothetical protein MYMAC_004047 [Corallococcus macrosporus DSM 14697]
MQEGIDPMTFQAVKPFLGERVSLKLSDARLTILRSGWQCTLSESQQDRSLAYSVAGQIPYYYRSPSKIALDFQERRHALEMVLDLATKIPRTPKFQRSHFGEILCSVYLEEAFSLRRLYAKLSMTTAEDTNVHKMDAFFVNTKKKPYDYIAVEAKTSIRPMPGSKFTGHRQGIYRQLIQSLDGYGASDGRFDLVAIRDNLERESFTSDEAKQIRQDLVPPGPPSLKILGMAVVNTNSVIPQDIDYVLTASCKQTFEFEALVVTDLASLAGQAYKNVKQHLGGRK